MGLGELALGGLHPSCSLAVVEFRVAYEEFSRAERTFGIHSECR
jgi:hypothetical protein